MRAYISPKFSNFLAKNKIDTFEKIWALEVSWFEEPNKRGEGWSGVSYIELASDIDVKLQGIYLKKQSAYVRKTWRNPLKGEPTFIREYKTLRFLETCDVVTPDLIYFHCNRHQSILMVAALAEYQAADEWFKKNRNVSVKEKNNVISAIAIAVRKMHKTGLEHRALYLKHLFIQALKSEEISYRIAIIDFEKSRIRYFIWFYRYSDLIKLWRRSSNFTFKQKLYFYKCYFDIEQLSFFDKRIVTYLKNI